MSSAHEPKLSYSSAQCRVRVEFVRAACMVQPEPPQDLVLRAKAKMESVKRAGEIDFFVVYESRLREAWKRFAKADDEAFDQVMQVTLAAGAKDIPGIEVTPPTHEKAIATLTITTPASILAATRYEAFKLVFQRKMREAGINAYANNAQIHAAYIRASQGEPVHDLPIAPAGSADGDKPYSVIANRARAEVGVLIRDVRVLRDKTTRDAMLNLVSHAIKQVQTNDVQMRLLKNEFLLGLQQAQIGPESVGIDLPLILLAAVSKPRQARNEKVIDHPGAGKLKVSVTPDKMEATIFDFDLSLYEDPTFKVDLDWIKNELARLGITAPMTDEIQKDLSDAIAKQENLDGMVVAYGRKGRGGRGPFLHAVYNEAQWRVEANLDEDDVDLRELQQRTTVKAGQLVAEIRYTEPPEPGMDVYGHFLPPPDGEPLIIRVGEGIQQRASGKFYATCDGIPLIDKDTIALSKMLVHQGDVNLRTGNINFDGPVEIKGSIDSGATVQVSGDLVVHGSVRGGFVRSGGNVTVYAGICTTEQGRIQARGEIRADFIENSNITCGGDLIVRKALINSNVISGGIIRVTAPDGLIAGGRLSCRESLYTGNLGFRHGAITHLNVGVDWRVELAVRVRTARLERLRKVQVETRQAFRELMQKNPAQMTKKHRELKEELQDRVQRLRFLLDRCESHLAKAQALLNYNVESKVFVRETLIPNVELHVGGQKITVINEVAGVAVIAKRRRGTHIHPIEEIEAEGKKAS